MIKGLIESLFLHLSAILTLVIPNLYKVFEYLATVQILTDDKVREIWNNLYILLSVLILFAIAIKLVNAIVNPDVLTDQKKGVRKAFFNAVIAVFLVALLPIFFGMFHEVQQHIVEDKIIQRFVFNDESEENGGTKMTWVAISSCMDLGKMDDIGIISLVDLGINAWNITTFGGHVVSTAAASAGLYIPDPSISNDESAYVFLLVLGNIRPWVTLANVLGEVIAPGLQLFTGTISDAIEDYFDFHPVILFIFLAVIAYELIIMVLDTALRAFKLALLELMTPIVLGAYVFKSDILKNWALEYIKTFLQVFLLLIALCFVEEVIPVIARISSVNESGYNLLNAFIRLLLYAGALRLVKQIGPLINKIFGTNIQAKGGIKGRLGEMAVVGGLAQKAWGALGNGIKNVGATGLRLAGAGIGLGINAGWKKFQKANPELGKKAVNIPNTKAGRIARAVGTAVGGAWKGKKISDIANDTKTAYGKVTNPLDTIALRENFMDQMVDQKTGINTSTGHHSAKDSNGEFKKRKQNLEEKKNTDNFANQRIKNKENQASYKDDVDKTTTQTAMDTIWSQRDSASEGIKTIIDNARTRGRESKASLDELDKIKTKFDEGKFLSEADLKKLSKADGATIEQINAIGTNNTRAQKGIEALLTDSDFAAQKKALADMLKIDVGELKAEKILKKSDIGGPDGFKATIEGAVKIAEEDFQTRLKQTGDETLIADANIMKTVSIGAGVHALNNVIFAGENKYEFKPDESTTAPTPPAPPTPSGGFEGGSGGESSGGSSSSTTPTPPAPPTPSGGFEGGSGDKSGSDKTEVTVKLDSEDFVKGIQKSMEKVGDRTVEAVENASKDQINKMNEENAKIQKKLDDLKENSESDNSKSNDE